MRGLYAIADLDTLERRGLALLPFAEAVLAAGPAALQLRAKAASPERTVELLRQLRPLCSRAGVPLVANDRVEVAIMAKTDMLHLGQQDASPALVRALAPGLLLGISTHTPEQLVGALAKMPRYVAYGPVYATRSKAQPDPAVGVRGLEQAAHLVRHVGEASRYIPPLVAIGGITLERAVELAPIVPCVAVIAGLLPPETTQGDDAYEHVRVRAAQLGAAFSARPTLQSGGAVS